MKPNHFYLLFAAWVIAVVSTLGSLFFSEIMAFPPCSLCWYQRICMYPLAIIIPAGLFPPDIKVIGFAMPIALIGWGFALYHNLLHWGIIPESAAPCRQGIPCSTVYIDWLGFITIPMMALVAFSLIIILLVQFKRNQS